MLILMVKEWKILTLSRGTRSSSSSSNSNVVVVVNEEKVPICIPKN